VGGLSLLLIGIKKIWGIKDELKKKSVCIVGLGYVGLPTAYLCLEKGFDVYGFDIDKDKVSSINDIKATTNPEIIKQADIVIVCVPTPVDINHEPDRKPLISAVKTVSNNIRQHQLILIESTIYPGVMEDIIKPILEESGLKVGEDFYLSYCPERIDPGNKKWRIDNTPRVYASFCESGAMKTKEFYEKIINAEIRQTSTIKTAEAVKLVENIFRDVNIALVNELALSFESLGIDIVETINCASTKPHAFLSHYPGCGVGGQCIPIDPYYLIYIGKENSFEYNLLNIARSINNSMPRYAVQRVLDGLKEINENIKRKKIAVLGLTYKKDIDDDRNSPANEIIKSLKKIGADIIIYDPYLIEKSTVKDLDSALNSVDCIIIATDHTEFNGLTAEALKKKKIKFVFDGKNCLNKKEIEKVGIIYKGIGR